MEPWIVCFAAYIFWRISVSLMKHVLQFIPAFSEVDLELFLHE
jgi:hypothetical protein